MTSFGSLAACLRNDEGMNLGAWQVWDSLGNGNGEGLEEERRWYLRSTLQIAGEVPKPKTLQYMLVSLHFGVISSQGFNGSCFSLVF